MKVTVNTDLCAATGGCTLLCPDVFELGADGLIIVRQEHPDESLFASVNDAADLCPTGAIDIDESPQ